MQLVRCIMLFSFALFTLQCYGKDITLSVNSFPYCVSSSLIIDDAFCLVLLMGGKKR